MVDSEEDWKNHLTIYSHWETNDETGMKSTEPTLGLASSQPLPIELPDLPS